MNIAVDHNFLAAHSVKPGRGREPSTTDDLLWMATTRFCATEDISRLTQDQYREAFYLLISEVSEKTKRAISAILADCTYLQRAIAIYLALEEIEIATPILAHSRVLGQLDLMQIVEKRGAAHRKIVATRYDIGPSLVQRLRRDNDQAINLALAQNRALADDGAERSAEVLFTELRTRHDDVDARLTNFETVVSKRQKKNEASSAEDKLLHAAGRGKRLPQLESPVAKVEQETFVPINFGDALEKAARAKSSQALAVIMRKQTGISLDTAHEVLQDRSGDTFSVLMRAYGVNDAQANRILLLAQPSIGLSVQNAMRSVRFYAKLQKDSCRQAVAQWPRDEHSAPVHHQPYMEAGKPVRRIATSVQSISWASQDAERRKAG